MSDNRLEVQNSCGLLPGLTLDVIWRSPAASLNYCESYLLCQKCCRMLWRLIYLRVVANPKRAILRKVTGLRSRFLSADEGQERGARRPEETSTKPVSVSMGGMLRTFRMRLPAPLKKHHIL